MKKGLMFAALACSLMMGVVACNNSNNGGGQQQGGGDQQGGGEQGGGQTTYEVSIQNKEALRREWRVGDDYRSVTVKIPGVVVQEALAKGDLVISSDHVDVVSVTGNQATPVGAGTATLTATYKNDFSDSVEVTVLKGKVYKMVSQPDEETEYLLAHKEAGGSSKLYSASMTISNNYYIGWETEAEDFPVAKVVIDKETESEYKYSIKLSKTNAEGEVTEKTVSVVNTAAGKFAAGFVGENDGKGHDYTAAAMFKIDDEHRLVATCVDSDTDKTVRDLYLGCSSGYNTTGVDTNPSKIVNPTRLYALSAEEIPTETLTVDKESLTLRPNGVGELKATVEPFDTTDELTFTSSGAGLLAAPNGTISALDAGEYTVTVKSGAKTVEVPVTVAGDVIPVGTRENPLTVDEAVASLDLIGKNHMSPRPLYVQGVVHSVDSKGAWNPTYKNASWWLQDENGAKKFELYRCVCEEGIDGAEVKVGDFVKAFGFGTLYNTTYELTTSATGNPASPTMYFCGEAPAVPLRDITVPAELNVVAGQTANVTVAPVPATAELGEVTLSWKEATTVAEIVEGELQIRGLAEGDATLVVAAGEISKEIPVHVTEEHAGVPVTVTKTITELTTANSWTVSSGSGDMPAANFVLPFELDSVITVSGEGQGNTGTVWDQSGTKEIRFYANDSGSASITFTAATGYTIQSITLTFTLKNGGSANFALTSGTADVVNAATKTYTISKKDGASSNPQLKVSGISVTYIAD